MGREGAKHGQEVGNESAQAGGEDSLVDRTAVQEARLTNKGRRKQEPAKEIAARGMGMFWVW
jgi:hypothetical protein